MERALFSRKITAPETAAIFMYVFGGESDWKKVYMAAAGLEEEDVDNEAMLAQYTSKWKYSAKIKVELERVKMLKDNLLKEAQRMAFDEGKRAAYVEIENGEDNKPAGRRVDYTDPTAQKEKLNEIINSAKDSGEALDALKVIIQGQRQDTEAAKQKQIQRFYTPLQCRDCPLYNEKKEKFKK